MEDLIRVDEIAGVITRADDAAWLARYGVTPRRNFTGWSCELPTQDPLIAAVAAKIHASVQIADSSVGNLRFRRYEPGDYHPRHFDAYAFDARLLVATAMLCLTAPEAGGETVFPAAAPPLTVAPKAGRLLVWRNVRHDGSDDPAALHESLPVIAGLKVMLTAFIYQSGWSTC